MSTQAGRTSKRSITTRLGMFAAAGICAASMSAAITAVAQEYPRPEGSSATAQPDPGQGNGLDVTSAAMGAMGGLALGAAALGITLGVQRRQDHVA